jgi:hypothetical protein
MDRPVRRVPGYAPPQAEVIPKAEGIVTAKITETALLSIDESDPNSAKEVYYVLIISVLYENTPN